MYNTIFIMLEGCDSFYGEKQFANGNSLATMRLCMACTMLCFTCITKLSIPNKGALQAKINLYEEYCLEWSWCKS